LGDDDNVKKYWNKFKNKDCVALHFKDRMWEGLLCVDEENEELFVFFGYKDGALVFNKEDYSMKDYLKDEDNIIEKDEELFKKAKKILRDLNE